MYPKWLYEVLPAFYVVCGGVSLKALPRPYGLVPAGAFAVAAGMVIIQRWYYRRQLIADDDV